MSSGYNWRGTLGEFARIAGVLSGFCITFIALILGGRAADTSIYNSGVTFGQISVLCFGVSCGLLVAAAEFFLKAKECDVFSIPESYRILLKEDCKQAKKEWAEFEDSQTGNCRANESSGRYCYNAGIFGILIGLTFVIIPYNPLIGIAVGLIGMSLQLWQIYRARK